jgi:hypothetical protein
VRRRAIQQRPRFETDIAAFGGHVAFTDGSTVVYALKDAAN